MSQRLGMADGRCFTVNSSSQLYNNYVMNKMVFLSKTTIRFANFFKKKVQKS